MGLASKLRANQAQAAQQQAPPQSVGPAHPQPAQYGGVAPPQYGAAPPQFGVAPPTTSFGGVASSHPAPPGGSQNYGSGFAASAQNASMYENSEAYRKEMAYNAGSVPPAMHTSSSSILSSLQRCVADKHLQRFYSDRQLAELAERIKAIEPRVTAMMQEWNLPAELAHDFYKLSLYDVIMLCDDSGSMAFEEKGERIRDLETIISYVAKATALFDEDGISVRFLNSSISEDGITDARQVEALVRRVNFSGVTPLGTSLQQKVLDPFFYSQLRQNNFTKPLLVVIITDGTPAGEPINQLDTVLANLYSASNGGQGVSVAIAQVGSDQSAQEFLGKMDKTSQYNSMVDVTSNFEMEQTEYMRKGIQLSPTMWICKLLMGAIDPTYDEQDE